MCGEMGKRLSIRQSTLWLGTSCRIENGKGTCIGVTCCEK
nr:MAG TPA: hypothetical protein [Caudoviricetes sp.]